MVAVECSHFANTEGILDSGLQQSCPQSFRQTNEMPCGPMQENEAKVLFPKKQPGPMEPPTSSIQERGGPVSKLGNTAAW